MKNLLKLTSLLTIALLAFTSCQQEDVLSEMIPTPEVKPAMIRGNASSQILTDFEVAIKLNACPANDAENKGDVSPQVMIYAGTAISSQAYEVRWYLNNEFIGRGAQLNGCFCGGMLRVEVTDRQTAETRIARQLILCEPVDSVKMTDPGNGSK